MANRNSPPCQICGKPSKARGYCRLHYERWCRNGEVETTLRPDDWGKRHKHPLWGRWKQTSGAKAPQGRCERWGDFWLFVEDVGPMPERARMERYDSTAPWSPENFYWKEPIQEAKALADKAAYMKKWRSQNLARAKGYELKRRFGMTLDEYHTMLDKQGGGCAICGDVDPYFKHMAVDHCHDTGRVRGILCCACNRALGGFKDKIEILRKAVAYLER